MRRLWRSAAACGRLGGREECLGEDPLRVWIVQDEIALKIFVAVETGGGAGSQQSFSMFTGDEDGGEEFLYFWMDLFFCTKL